MAEAVLLDPYQPYAGLFISRLYRDHGVRTIALHRDWRTRLTLEPRLPILHSPAVSAHYMVPPDGVTGLVPTLQSRHDVVAVLPHDEGAVQPLATLADLLDLDWAQPAVLPYFGSKFALKRLLALVDPGLRLNRFTDVRDAGEVLRWVGDNGVRRFVLKPDDGSGNRGVAFFDADTEPAHLADYFADATGQILAEEFIGGEEYWVNGQVDHAGTPIVTSIGVYERQEINGKENVEVGGRTITTGHPEFASLFTYAERVMTATGLRRSPFHLEAKVDGEGPCLVEVGARLCGTLLVLADEWQHGPSLDLIGAAVHGYVSDEPHPPLPLDWHHYDKHMVCQIYGWTSQHEILGRVEGVEGVEDLPGFLFWSKEPHIGDTVVPTLDLITPPWGVVMGGASDSELDEREARARQLLKVVGMQDLTGGWRARLPAYRNRMGRYWGARPRPYMLRAGVDEFRLRRNPR